MKTTFLKYWYFLLVISIPSRMAYSQIYPWQTNISINVNIDTYFNRTECFDIAYDNYGLHFVGIKNNSNPSRQLNYFHIDNMGNILEQVLNLESNVHGVAISNYKGKVFIILRIANATSGNTFKVYQAINGVTSLELVGSFTPQFYSTPGQISYLTKMDLVPISLLVNNQAKDWLVLSWDYANYLNGSIMGNIGFAIFKPEESTLSFFNPIDYQSGNTDILGGVSPQLTTSPDRIHVVYSRFIDSLTFFVSRDISFADGSPTYQSPLLVSEWNGPGPDLEYVADEETRANIIYGNNKLLILANLLFESGNLYLDSKFKLKSLSDPTWPASSVTLIHENFNYFKHSAVIFDQNTNKVGMIFTGASTGSRTFFQEYDLEQNQFQSRETLYVDNQNFLTGGSLSNNAQGDFAVFSKFYNRQDYVGFRRARALTGQITYNTLLTGYEYFNAPTSPYCRTNGADIEALGNSTTRLLQNTRIFIDENDQIIFRPNSCLIFESNSEIFPDPGPVIYQTDCITWAKLHIA